MSEWDEILKKLNGFDLPDATLQADHIIMQALDGVRIDRHNRERVREYLILHLISAEERGRREGITKALVEAKRQNLGCD
jgi:hypothetical protein